MQPRRDLFAREYIAETVEHFLACANECSTNATLNRDVRWATVVLDEYFNAVVADDGVREAEKKFRAVDIRVASTGIRRYHDLRDHGISPALLMSLASHRRSVRWFHRRRVDRSDIDGAIRIAQEAPSACNRQPYCYRIVEDHTLVAAVAGTAAGTAGFAEGIPCIVVLTGDYSSFADETDRNLAFIDPSLSAMLFLLALDCYGLAACTLNWKDDVRRERKLRQLLDFPEVEQVVMLIAVGYPDADGGVPLSIKQDIEMVRRYVSTNAL